MSLTVSLINTFSLTHVVNSYSMDTLLSLIVSLLIVLE